MLRSISKINAVNAKAPINKNSNFWVAVVSREHALRGISEGFVQVCHGKQAPLKRMRQNDWIFYYSPREKFEGKTPCQKFVGIGKVRTGNVYQFEVNKSFKPHRVDIDFLKEANEISINPLINELNFIKNKQSWGMFFRMGHFKIAKEDFELIANSMGIVISQEELTLPVSKNSEQNNKNFIENDAKDNEQEQTQTNYFGFSGSC